MNNCLFFVEEHDMNATIYDCKLRNDGNAYPSHSPNCASCELYTTAADAMQAVALSKRLVRCKDCEFYSQRYGGACTYHNADPYEMPGFPPNGFCSYGIRRDGGQQDG